VGTSRHPLIEGFCAACKPADRHPPWQWCEEHVHVDETSPLPGRWRSDASPWVKPVMEDFANNAVRDIAVQCAAQSAKTQTVMNCACWAIAEDPGPAMWVTATKDELRDFLRDRLTPTFETCRPVKERMAEPTLTGFAFDGMPFYAGWSGSKARLQSKPIRYVFADEVRNYAPGRLEMLLKRTRSFWNSRRFLISTPGTKGDAMDTAYRAGDQRVWHFECPNCGHLQPLKFEQLKWDTNDTTKPEGKWRFDALADTIRFECAGCGHRIKDTPIDRRWIEIPSATVRIWGAVNFATCRQRSPGTRLRERTTRHTAGFGTSPPRSKDAASRAVRQARVADLLSSRPEASQLPYTVCAGHLAGRPPMLNRVSWAESRTSAGGR